MRFRTGVLDGSKLSGLQNSTNGVQRQVYVVRVGHFSGCHNPATESWHCRLSERAKDVGESPLRTLSQDPFGTAFNRPLPIVALSVQILTPETSSMVFAVNGVQIVRP